MKIRISQGPFSRSPNIVLYQTLIQRVCVPVPLMWSILAYGFQIIWTGEPVMCVRRKSCCQSLIVTNGTFQAAGLGGLLQPVVTVHVHGQSYIWGVVSARWIVDASLYSWLSIMVWARMVIGGKVGYTSDYLLWCGQG